jgi:hypothetical protein
MTNRGLLPLKKGRNISSVLVVKMEEVHKRQVLSNFEGPFRERC